MNATARRHEQSKLIMLIAFESELDLEDRILKTLNLILDSLSSTLDVCKTVFDKSLLEYYERRVQGFIENKPSMAIDEEFSQAQIFNQHMSAFADTITKHFDAITENTHASSREIASFVAKQVSRSIAAHVQSEIHLMRCGPWRRSNEMVTNSHIFCMEGFKSTVHCSTSRFFWENMIEVRKLILQNSFRMFKGMRMPLKQYQELQLAACLAMHARAKEHENSWIWALGPEIWQLIWTLTATWN